MTGFILHGGYTRYDNEDNKNFFKELLNECIRLANRK